MGQDHGLIAGVKPLKTPPGRVRYLESKRLARVLLEKCPAWLRPIVLIAAGTGMHRGEIVGLHRNKIPKAKSLIHGEKTENNESKTIPMNKTVQAVIDAPPPRLDTPYAFAEEDGQPINPERVTIAFHRAVKAAGIRDFRFHDLTPLCQHLTMSGQNQRVIQELLGHKSPAMTALYSHLSPEAFHRR